MTRRWIVTCAGLVALSVAVLLAQYTAITTSGTLPTCGTTPGLYIKSGASPGLYVCLGSSWTGPLATSGGSGTAFDHVGFVFDGGGSDITTGTSKAIRFPQVNGTIVRVSLLADVACDVSVDLWSTTFSTTAYPDDTDTITGGNEPELTADLAMEDSTLTSWTTAFTAGDTLLANIDSTSGCGSLVVIVDYSYGT